MFKTTVAAAAALAVLALAGPASARTAPEFATYVFNWADIDNDGVLSPRERNRALRRTRALEEGND